MLEAMLCRIIPSVTEFQALGDTYVVEHPASQTTANVNRVFLYFIVCVKRARPYGWTGLGKAWLTARANVG